MLKQLNSLWVALFGWLDNSHYDANANIASHEIDWARVIPFLALHLACFAIIFVGFSWFALLFALALYVIRMFAITAFYHRYFAHKAFKTSRFGQFIFAILGASAVQRGPLWWASHHRNHHAHSDELVDAHSPHQHGFLWSHIGWFLDRFDIIIPIALGSSIYALGEALHIAAPALQTNGLQLFTWGFVLSTVLLYHGTFCVNSLAHVWGNRRYATRDESRNNGWIALITLGEGWHNNHHHFPGSAKQGFYWWEIDFTYYGLRVLAALGIIWDLKIVPIAVKNAHIKN
jgi:stearoyl-CoA desaturase (delta-9 desaturase)